MGLAKPKPAYYTVDEYLKIDRESDERYEFLDGEIYLMAGESTEHGRISTNLTGILFINLRNSPCESFSKDTKVRSGAEPEKARTTRGMFSYPDAVVVCGGLQHHDKYRDIVTNPTVIFEILSESTGEFDRGEKFMRYRNWNPTLTDYVLISQDKPMVEHFTRQNDGSWLFREYRGLDASFTITSINSHFNLADIFDRIEFVEVED